MTVSYERDRLYTVEEYLRLEAESQEKHEYIDGRIIPLGEALAMAGGSVNHSRITLNVGAELRARLKDGPCSAFESNLRVRIPRKAWFAYPDVTVVCGEPEVDADRSAGETVTNPTLIVEVVSPSTELYDRGKKFDRYREMPTLREYVVVAQSEARVECFFRREDGGWTFYSVVGRDAVAKLRSLNVDLPLSEVYARVNFSPSTDPRVGQHV